MIIYKYLPISRIDVLKYSRIRFSQPAILNDPFESFPCFLEFGPWIIDLMKQHLKTQKGVEINEQLDSYIQKIVVEKLLDIPTKMSEHFVILSLSKTCSQPLMWSHYADSHQGFVIGFDSDSTFFREGNGKGIDGLKEVEYSNDRFVIPSGGIQNKEKALEANTGIFFTKGEYWKYEEEVRILAHPASADASLPSDEGFEILLFNFPKESIREVIMGFRISNENQRKIFDITREIYPSAKIGKAFPHQSEFKVDINFFKD